MATLKVAPPTLLFSAQSRPPWASTMVRDTAKPTPMPFSFVDVFGMNTGSPPPSQQFLQRLTGEIEPRLIKDIDVTIQPRCMEQRRGRIDKSAKKWSLIFNRDWVVFRHSGYGKSSREPREQTAIFSSPENVKGRKADATST
jgi:hypothetical protein